MRFNKIIKQENGSDVICLIDSETKSESFAISGESVLALIRSSGEGSAKSTLISIVQSKYPDLSKEELEELFG